MTKLPLKKRIAKTATDQIAIGKLPPIKLPAKWQFASGNLVGGNLVGVSLVGGNLVGGNLTMAIPRPSTRQGQSPYV